METDNRIQTAKNKTANKTPQKEQGKFRDTVKDTIIMQEYESFFFKETKEEKPQSLFK